jgi:hypothetical protein
MSKKRGSRRGKRAERGGQDSGVAANGSPFSALEEQFFAAGEALSRTVAALAE